ncbi:hypothetical protein BCR44DRAFT_98171 [Catenaria anguillulae PL171]|uniref:Uncharacterized protein n=1 Tax=Catenaria anguillulae PL171 TaxID=765915 RepID=A0A1Y2HBS5_9FUNG|nr:hypothetical protein BCR44DRAFT_98171 [Catenaria anguillulae PL171]
MMIPKPVTADTFVHWLRDLFITSRLSPQPFLGLKSSSITHASTSAIPCELVVPIAFSRMMHFTRSRIAQFWIGGSRNPICSSRTPPQSHRDRNRQWSHFLSSAGDWRRSSPPAFMSLGTTSPSWPTQCWFCIKSTRIADATKLTIHGGCKDTYAFCCSNGGSNLRLDLKFPGPSTLSAASLIGACIEPCILHSSRKLLGRTDAIGRWLSVSDTLELRYSPHRVVELSRWNDTLGDQFAFDGDLVEWAQLSLFPRVNGPLVCEMYAIDGWRIRHACDRVRSTKAERGQEAKWVVPRNPLQAEDPAIDSIDKLQRTIKVARREALETM